MKTKKLVTSAMFIALSAVIAYICDMIPFLNLPFGGTVTIGSMLPLILISYMYGIKWGLVSGFTYSVLQLFLSTGTISALFLPESDSYMGLFAAVSIVLCDYVLSYTSLGLGGIFRHKMSKTKAILCGTVLSMLICYIFRVISGFAFYGAWADWFFNDTVMKGTAFSQFITSHFSGKMLAFLYSVIYNGCYMIPEIVITLVIGFFTSRAVPEKE